MHRHDSSSNDGSASTGRGMTADAETGVPLLLGGERHVVAFAHSRRGGSAEILAAIDPTPYDVVDVVVRRTMVDELAAIHADVVVIDNQFGDFDVKRVCRDVRRSLGSRILVLATDERADDEVWTVDVIEAGADDVVAASISAALLRTHLLALMRLASDRDPHRNDVVVGDVVVDVDGFSVFVAGRLVRFPSLQFKLLLALARRPNRVVSFAQLLSEVWGVEPPSVNPRRVRVAASILRRLLGEGARRPRVETVSRVGYRLVVPPERRLTGSTP
jgi:two-component system response regulator MtrA